MRPANFLKNRSGQMYKKLASQLEQYADEIGGNPWFVPEGIEGTFFLTESERWITILENRYNNIADFYGWPDLEI